MIKFLSRKSEADAVKKTSDELQTVRTRVRRLCQFPITDAHGTTVLTGVPDDRFIKSDAIHGVHFILCSLNKISSESVTVMNIVMGEGALIHKHTHNSCENVFVVDGNVKELVSGKTYERGESFSIKANVPHALSSDYALLTSTWRPAFATSLDEEAEYKIGLDKSCDDFKV